MPEEKNKTGLGGRIQIGVFRSNEWELSKKKIQLSLSKI